jgi:hypothetical protein
MYEIIQGQSKDNMLYKKIYKKRREYCLIVLLLIE